MSRTFRRTYKGRIVREGTWCHRCPEPKCEWCVSKPSFPKQEHITRSREEQ